MVFAWYNRWNWSEKAKKWVYVSKKRDGQRKYIYQIEPPERFMKYTIELNNLNEKLMTTVDPEKNEKIFEKLMRISRKLQAMEKEELK